MGDLQVRITQQPPADVFKDVDTTLLWVSAEIPEGFENNGLRVSLSLYRDTPRAETDRLQGVLGRSGTVMEATGNGRKTANFNFTQLSVKDTGKFVLRVDVQHSRVDQPVHIFSDVFTVSRPKTLAC